MSYHFSASEAAAIRQKKLDFYGKSFDQLVHERMSHRTSIDGYPYQREQAIADIEALLAPDIYDEPIPF